jgi:hypothetical protein
MAIFAGVGYLLANDVLTDCSYALIEPPVNTTVPGGGIAAGAQTVDVFDLAMYVGAQILVGVLGGDLEVVTITAVVPGTSFSAVFVNAHVAGEPIVGATFPVQQSSDPFFTQAEMLAYLANAVNDFLSACPLVIAVTTAVSVAPTAQNAALPADCQKPTRVGAYGVPLRETSQSNLDSMDYRWNQQAAAGPYCYFRDKTGLQNLGIFPRANNTTPLEIVYEQRGAAVVGLADGFILPDPFLIYIKYRVLSYAYSKDGEQRNPGLARYYEGRYTAGVKISTMILEAVMDPNLEMAQ